MSQSERLDRSYRPELSVLHESVHARSIIAAARRLVAIKGSGFTTREIVQESGVALKTFYRYFASKDRLLLAVIGDIIAESCVGYDEQTRTVDDPLVRLRYYLTSVVLSAYGSGAEVASSRFVLTEHWRLGALYPDELALAVSPFTQLILRDILQAQDAGLLAESNAAYYAWLVTQLAISVYHHQASKLGGGEDGSAVAEEFWGFCLSALGGIPR